MSKMTELQNAEVRIKEVAERISNLREDLGISVEEMAVNTGYSVEDYKKYESGEQDFSFTFIYKCAKALNSADTQLPARARACLSFAERALPTTALHQNSKTRSLNPSM